MQLPIAYLDAAAIEEVAIEVWKDVFDAVGWPPSLASVRNSFGHEDVLRALSQDAPTDPLLQALEALEAFGTETGREAVMSAMQDRGVPTDTLPANKGDKEFALRFYIAQRTDAALADAFLRAQIQVQEGGNQRRYNEFLGKEARRIKNLDGKKEALREEILDFCRKSDLGDHVHVEAFEDDGIYIFNILHSHRTQKPLAVVAGHSARATIQYRPVHGDVIQYDARLGRLRVAARTSSMVECYRRVLGLTLFKDEDFFDGNAVCSLKVLQERGREALDSHEVFGVGRIRMTECLWERGDRDLLQIRSNDCFRSIEELDLNVKEGVFIQAKLKCDVVGKSTRPVTVNIRVPSRIEISQRSQETLIERVLDAVGIRNAAPRSATVSLWALHPWRHPAEVWRMLFGAETDKLVQGQVLAPVQLESVPHPDHVDAGRVLEAHALSDSDFYGTSRVPEIPSRALTPTDLDGLELMPEAFRLYLRSVLGITNGGAVWDKGELLDLGVIEVGEYRIFLVYALRAPASGSGDKIRTRAGGAHPVCLIPSSQVHDFELAKITLESALPTRRVIIREAAHACGLADCIPALYTAPDRARLIVDTRMGKVWVDGVEIANLPPGSKPFQFITFMARHSTPVSRDEIVKEISPGRTDEDTVARQAKSSANKLIVNAMSAADRNWNEDPFPNAGTGFYRCALPAYVR